MLHHSFDDYSQIYAKTQNEQMLLNLARLREREPVYFFQLAGIQASYTISGTTALSATKGNSASSPTSAFTHTDAAAIGGTFTHTPVFNFIPLAGSNFAQQLLTPIRPEVFYELYEQGWPVDQLMRLLIQRIVVTLPPRGRDGIGGEYYKDNKRIYVLENDPAFGSQGHYDMFLRACGMARQFQAIGALVLDHFQQFQPIMPKVIAFPASGSANAAAAELKLIDDAYKDGLVYRPAEEDWNDDRGFDGGFTQPSIYQGKWWQLGKVVDQTAFRIAENNDTFSEIKAWIADPNNASYRQLDTLELDIIESGYTASKEDRANPNWQTTQEHSPDAGVKAFAALVDSFSVTSGSSTGPTGLGSTKAAASPSRKPQVQLVMRSLLSAMSAAAHEEDSFATLLRREPDFRSQIPDRESRPAISLEREATPHPADVLVEVAYAGKHYRITNDPGSDPLHPDTWDRDAFSLLEQLSFAVSVDPSKIAQTGLIQLY